MTKVLTPVLYGLQNLPTREFAKPEEIARNVASNGHPYNPKQTCTLCRYTPHSNIYFTFGVPIFQEIFSPFSQ